MAVNKRGIYFTALSLLLISLMFFTFTISTYRFTEKSYVVETRVNTMNNFLEDVYTDMDRGMMIAGYRTIISMQKQVSVIETFIDDFDLRFTELFWNGTFNGTEIGLMGDAAMEDWGDRIAEQALMVNMELNFTVQDVIVNQSSPWAFDIFYNVTIDLVDVSGMASWHTNILMNHTIPIVGFEDPLYTVMSGDRVVNVIQTSNLTDLVFENDTANLLIYLNGSYYQKTNRSPSYLQRFVGDLSPSEFGIESLVNLAAFQKQGIVIYDRSVVDFIYFEDSADAACVAGNKDWINVNGMPSWFRMTNKYLGQDVMLDYELDEAEGNNKEECT